MSEEKSKTTGKSLTSKLFSGVGPILLILIALFVVFSVIRGDVFLSSDNIQDLLLSTAVNGITALGMTCCIICGGVDLAAGSTIGMAAMVVSYFTSGQIAAGGLVPIFVAMLIAVAAGALVGFINGILINDGGLPPFIATIGMQIIIRQSINLIFEARIIAQLPTAFTDIALNTILGIPIMAFVWFVLAIITWLIIKFTPFGRNIFAVGSNAETARLSGISLRATRCGAWVYSGVMSAIAGILLCARLGNGIPSTGSESYEFMAIASSVVGGASMSGGEGSVLGTFIGAIILQTIRNGGIIIGMNAHLLEMIVGAIIIIAVLFDKNSGSN